MSWRREAYSLAVLLIVGIAMLTLGPSLHSLDIRYYYTQDEARAFLDGLTSSEVSAYVRTEFLDLLFISSYTSLFYFLARRRAGARSALRQLAFVPGFLDLVETSTILLILFKILPDPPIWLGAITCAKWTTGTLFIITLVTRRDTRK